MTNKIIKTNPVVAGKNKNTHPLIEAAQNWVKSFKEDERQLNFIVKLTSQGDKPARPVFAPNLLGKLLSANDGTNNGANEFYQGVERLRDINFEIVDVKKKRPHLVNEIYLDVEKWEDEFRGEINILRGAVETHNHFSKQSRELSSAEGKLKAEINSEVIDNINELQNIQNPSASQEQRLNKLKEIKLFTSGQSNILSDYIGQKMLLLTNIKKRRELTDVENARLNTLKAMDKHSKKANVLEQNIEPSIKALRDAQKNQALDEVQDTTLKTLLELKAIAITATNVPSIDGLNKSKDKNIINNLKVLAQAKAIKDVVKDNLSFVELMHSSGTSEEQVKQLETLNSPDLKRLNAAFGAIERLKNVKQNMPDVSAGDPVAPDNDAGEPKHSVLLPEDMPEVESAGEPVEPENDEGEPKPCLIKPVVVTQRPIEVTKTKLKQSNFLDHALSVGGAMSKVVGPGVGLSLCGLFGRPVAQTASTGVVAKECKIK